MQGPCATDPVAATAVSFPQTHINSAESARLNRRSVQGQEVAFVVAEDRYIAADAVDLVEVDYEELPALVDPARSMAADAPVLRDDLKDKTSGAHGPRKHHARQRVSPSLQPGVRWLAQNIPKERAQSG